MSLSGWQRNATRIFLSACIGALFLGTYSGTLADSAEPEAAKLLPVEIGAFRQVAPVQVLNRESLIKATKLIDDFPTEVPHLYDVSAEYVSTDGEKLSVILTRFENDSWIYSQFTFVRDKYRSKDAMVSQTPDIGTASVLTKTGSLFVFKGVSLLSITASTPEKRAQTLAFGQLLATGLDSGEGEIPVLVKHLPDWESVQSQAIYLVSSRDLQIVSSNQPILNEVTFDGGTEAVVGNYGQTQLVIVEFTTPQFSIDNDSRIWTKIAELKSKGEPTPTAYRRVGNYSVFVFNAPDEKTANALIEQVKYEQVVQWLGDDPHLYERLQRYFAETSAGVLIAVLKSSGLSLVLCLAAGALIGTMLFRHRRAQNDAAYSDAGGSIRLNLDDLTGSANKRLLKSESSSEQTPAKS